MINSSDIINHINLPSFIKHHDAFRKYPAFTKVFPSLGLENFSSSLEEVQGLVPFVFKHGTAFTDTAGNILLRLLDRVITTPFSYLMLISDYIGFCRFRFKHRHNSKMKIVFASDQKQGVWDIATMSMRGIRSCMQWGSGHAPSLIGSIIDPCCGVIYLTDGVYTEHGERMLCRSVVRYVVHKTAGPCLYMERPYAHLDLQPGNQEALCLAFAAALHAKTSLPVIYDYKSSYDDMRELSFIPATEAVKKYVDCQSYRDGKVRYDRVSLGDLMRFPAMNFFQGLFQQGV